MRYITDDAICSGMSLLTLSLPHSLYSESLHSCLLQCMIRLGISWMAESKSSDARRKAGGSDDIIVTQKKVAKLASSPRTVSSRRTQEMALARCDRKPV